MDPVFDVVAPPATGEAETGEFLESKSFGCSVLCLSTWCPY